MWPWQYLSEILTQIRNTRIDIEILRVNQAANFDRINYSLKVLRMRTAYVGPLRITITGEENMSLKFKVGLPPVTAQDVVSGELSVRIDGGDPIVVATAPADTEVVHDSFTGADGATVEMSYVLTDDAGNPSQPSVAVGTLTDTIAPPQPGQLALTVTEEVNDVV